MRYSTWLLAIGSLAPGCRAIGGDLFFDLTDTTIAFEICDNGIDDNGDGFLDCADPDCGATGFACVPVPDGWHGPVAFQEDKPDAIAECPSEYPVLAYEGGTGLEAEPPGCAACACGPAVVTCALEKLQTYTKMWCQPPKTYLTVAAGDCVTLESGVSSLRQDAPSANVEGCEPSGGEATVSPVAWASLGRVCKRGQSAGLGCADGSACARRPPAPFGAASCVWREGDRECPHDFPHRSFLVGVNDDRGCTPCACDDPPAATCSATTTLFDAPGCTSMLATLNDDGNCMNLENAVSAKVTVDVPPPGACAASGGEPTGAADPADAATICCPD